MAAHAALIIGLALLGSGRAPAKQTVAYRVTPELAPGGLQDLVVEISLRAGPDGKTRLDLPDRGEGETGRWRYISDLAVTGAAVSDDGPARRVLTSRPNAALEVRYRVRSAYAADPEGAGGNPYKGAIIRPNWFASLGDFVFVTPEGRDEARASFRWGPLPSGWKAGSSLEGGHGRRLTVADISQSTLIGGTDVRLAQRRLPKGRLHVAIRGGWSFSDKALVDDISRVVAAQRRFWGEEGGPYFVSVTPLAGSAAVGSSIGGTSKSQGFALYGTSNVTEAMLRRVLAHEHTHNWIVRRQGRLPEGPAEPGGYWFSEGFTDFYTARTLLRSGVWSPQEFLDAVNESLRKYDQSKVRTAPNSRIVADFWADPSVEELPYQRGFLLALLWDRAMRQASDGRVGLDAVMFQMRDRWVAAAADDKPMVVDSFVQKARDVAGLNLDDDLWRYVDEGAEIRLPADLFGACAKIATVSRPEYDLGYDAEASAAKGVFVGVDPAGPAYRAGLRDGMRRIAREGGEPGASGVEIVWRVIDANRTERRIAYRPAGLRAIAIQEASLTPNLSPARLAACGQTMSGAS